MLDLHFLIAEVFWARSHVVAFYRALQFCGEYCVDFKLQVHHLQNARLRSRKLSRATVESIVEKIALT